MAELTNEEIIAKVKDISHKLDKLVAHTYAIKISNVTEFTLEEKQEKEKKEGGWIRQDLLYKYHKDIKLVQFRLESFVDNFVQIIIIKNRNKKQEQPAQIISTQIKTINTFTPVFKNDVMFKIEEMVENDKNFRFDRFESIINNNNRVFSFSKYGCIELNDINMIFCI